MKVNLTKVLPSGQPLAWHLVVEQDEGRFRLVRIVAGKKDELARGRRRDSLTALAMTTARLRATGYVVTGGDEEYKRLHPGQFRVKLSLALREALDKARVGGVFTPTVARPQFPLARSKPRSRVEALRIGEED